MTTPSSVLEALQPPSGYRFRAGVWLTHDVSTAVLTDLVLPALAGVSADESLPRLSAPGDFDAESLIICAAADRIEAVGFVPEAVLIAPVTGRRLHAKVAVLHYVRAQQGSPRPRSLMRTIVTSANLTASGLTSNRELVICETTTSDARGAAIGPDVLDALRGVRRDIPGFCRVHLDRKLRDLAQARSQWIASSESVAHSIAQTPGQALVSGFGQRSADRILLVGPAFAANASDVAALMQQLVGSGTSVDLVVGARATQAQLSKGHADVEVPTGLLSGLRKRADRVNVHAVPSGDDFGAQRVLHGKAIFVQRGLDITQMVGSANLTRRGLGGFNRELVVFIDRPDLETIDDEISALGALLVNDAQIVPVSGSADLPDEVNPSKAPLLATFVPHPGHTAASGSIRGRIQIRAGDWLPKWIEIDGVRIRLVDGAADVVLGPNSVVGAAARAVLVTVTPAEGRGFWTSVPSDVRPRTHDQLLTRLLNDVDRASRTPKSRLTTPSGKPPGPGPVGGDGFSIPGNLRLNAVARYRQRLGFLDPEHERSILTSLFPDPVERMVAETILAGTRGGQKSGANAVLQALGDAVADSSGAKP